MSKTPHRPYYLWCDPTPHSPSTLTSLLLTRILSLNVHESTSPCVPIPCDEIYRPLEFVQIRTCPLEFVQIPTCSFLVVTSSLTSVRSSHTIRPPLVDSSVLPTPGLVSTFYSKVVPRHNIEKTTPQSSFDTLVSISSTNRTTSCSFFA